jgi:hypothetical protein
MRESVADYAWQAFNLSEQNLVCMAYSPFADGAAGLDRYLRHEQTHLAASSPAIHALLKGADNPDLASKLESISGLPVDKLSILYNGPLWPPSPDGSKTGLLPAILEGDPHQAVIVTRHDANTPDVLERISGR